MMNDKCGTARPWLAALLSLVLCACSAGGNGGGGGGGGGGIGTPPVAVPDAYAVPPNASAVSLDVLANDLDPAGGGLSLASVTPLSTLPPASAGSFSVQNNQVIYTPASGFIGVETAQYTVTGAGGLSATGLISIVVAVGSAPPPLAVADARTIAANSSNNSINVLANDLDPSGSGLTVTAVSAVASLPPASGDSLATNGTVVTYTPPADYSGVVTLQYTITDGNGNTSTAPILITVSPLPLPPIAVADLDTVVQDSAATLIDVLANDLDTSASGLTITAVTPLTTLPPGSTGTISTDGSTVSYQPAAGFAGVETFSYDIVDGNGGSSTGVVTVIVTPAALAVPPLALADAATIAADSSNNSISVLGNDLDPSGTGLTVTAVSEVSSLPPASGATLGTNGTVVTYTPPAGYSGVVTLQYTVTDGNGNISSAPILITVSPLPLPPIAVADVETVAQDSAATSFDVLANDLDVSASGLTITAVTPLTTLPPGSTGTISTDGSSVSYQPAAGFAGVETFSYDIVDGNGGSSTGVVTVTVTPAALVLPPVPLPDLANVVQDTANNLIDVLANDLSPSGGALSLTAVSVVSSLPSAVHAVAISGNQVDFTPAAGFAGSVTLSYTVSDGTSSAIGAAVVTVSPLTPTPPPVALPDAEVVSSSGGAVSIDVLANDVDPAGGGLTLTAASITLELPAGSGSVAVVGNQVQYTPSLGYIGSVTVTYTAQDALGRSTDGVLVLTVTP